VTLLPRHAPSSRRDKSVTDVSGIPCYLCLRKDIRDFDDSAGAAPA
jgi:hypothetical protein